jgi:uncharacterized protein (TIGR04255 family)
MADHLEMPLSGAPPKEIALRAAPLVSVIAQVRFPALLAVRSTDRMIGLQDLVRKTYPHLERQDIPTTFIIGPAPHSGSMGEPVVHWRFADGIGSDWKWRISLTQDFISLESRAYDSRQNFLERLETILCALESTLAPTHVTRLGIRYIDQIKGEAVSRIGSLLRSEVMGVASLLGENAKQFFTELHVAADPGDLQARWGKLPAGMTIDPNLVPPLTEDSWLIDLDVSKSQMSEFQTAAVIETAKLAAERVYAVFRWMVTPEFLKTYDGEA